MLCNLKLYIHKLLIFIVIIICVPSINAKDVITKEKLIGKSSFYYLFWHVYDISLYSKDKSFSFKIPFYLKLDYRMKISGKSIAERSTKEIKKLGFKNDQLLKKWNSQMESIFPNVKKMDSLVGYYNPGKPTIFYRIENKKKKYLGEIKDINFGKWFFGIWLNEKTSRPKLRKKLLGKI